LIVSSHVCAFLGILKIYGLDHFVIATEREFVCELPTYKQPMTKATIANVYRLKEVQLIPFFTLNHDKKESKLIQEDEEEHAAELDIEKIQGVVEKIKAYLSEGFFFAYNYDLTSNLQRQRRLYEQHGFSAKGHI